MNELLEERATDIVQNIIPESFAESDLRFFSQFLNDGVADNFIGNLTQNSGLSERAIASLVYWLNVYGRLAVPMSNMTDKDQLFDIRAECGLVFAPRRRQDLNNPNLYHIKDLAMQYYRLNATNATGPRRLGIRIFERNARVSVGSDEQENTTKGKKRGLFK